MFGFPRYLPLGKDSEARCDLASLRHGLDTASPLVVHGLRTGAISEYQGRRFFSLQRDITGLLRELVKNEDSTRWQMKHAKSVKNAIRIGFTELDTTYMTLSLATSIRPSVPTVTMSQDSWKFSASQDSFLGRSKSMSGGGRRIVDRSLRPAGSPTGVRASYYTHSRTNTVSSFDD
ncbi:hypothetical protein FRB94_011818 [Tulasnella sp. JGI-2019a]|nr:hypothetical protein FRB93_002266 [Tulasnella sp. JGI-2019a]KAG9014640.1 hypothetical protein FRB94_011818 [Tulasnella sp. JGI-2019a]KAG9038975.1 hypothetical protein FRB95_013653 [Tulasnella sp. JGI-2019a]